MNLPPPKSEDAFDAWLRDSLMESRPSARSASGNDDHGQLVDRALLERNRLRRLRLAFVTFFGLTSTISTVAVFFGVGILSPITLVLTLVCTLGTTAWLGWKARC